MPPKFTKMAIGIFALFACVSFNTCPVRAQTVSEPGESGPRVVILNETCGEYPLGRYLEILEAPENQWSVDDVVSGPLSGNFVTNTSDVPNFGFSKSAFWIRIRLLYTPENGGASGRYFYLELGYPLLDHVRLYRYEDGKMIDSRETGDIFPFRRREIKHRNFIFRLPVKPRRLQTIYLHIRTESSVQLPLTLWSPSAFAENANDEQFIFGFFYGILTVMIFYNFFLFISVRDINYLYFVLTILFAELFVISLNGLAYMYLWPNSPWWAGRSVPFFIAAAGSCGSFFSRSFLNAKAHMPILGNMMLFLVWAMALTSCFSLFADYRDAIRISAAFMFLIAPAFFVAGVMNWKKGHTPGPFFLMAMFVFLIGIVAYAMKAFGILPSNEFTEHTIQFGMAFVVILLSFAVGDRIKEESRKKDLAREKALKAEEQYQAIFHNALEGIFRATPEGRYIHANPALAEILGYDSPDDLLAELTDIRNRLFANPADLDRLLRTLLKNGKVVGYETRFYRRDGSQIWVMINLRAVADGTGKITHMEGMLADITEKKLAEAELIRHREQLELMVDERTKELKTAKEAAEAATRAKSEFLANMSHEIRTPMNSILGFAEILEGIIGDDKQARYLSHIRASGKSLLRLIDDILDLSKVEAGKLELVYTPTNIRSLIKDMEYLFMMQINEKGLEFIVEIEPGLPDFLLLDETRMRQILLNLVGNAVKFTESGHIRVSAGSGKTMGGEGKIDFAFSVEDTGIGVPADDKELIFGAFEQKKGQDSAKYGGAGLGLAITRRLVEMMNGKISMDEVEGGGSRFSIRIANVESLPGPAGKNPPINVDAIRFNGATVLVVDDNDFNRELIKGYLENHGCVFFEAKNGKEAVELALQHLPDVILMDMKMPLMDGFEASRIINSQEEAKHIPIIAVSAKVMKKDRKKINALCSGLLTKPIGKSELVSALSGFLEHTVREAAPPGPVHIQSDLGSVIEDGDLIREYEEIRETLIFHEVTDFVDKVKAIGYQDRCAALIEWGDEVMSHVENFDVDRLRMTFGKFRDYIGEEWGGK